MEVIIDFLFEFYIELMFFFVPEKNEASKKQRAIALAIATAVFILVFAAVVYGISLLFTGKTLIGWLIISFAIVVSLIHIVVSFVLRKKS